MTVQEMRDEQNERWLRAEAQLHHDGLPFTQNEARIAYFRAVATQTRAIESAADEQVADLFNRAPFTFARD